jgi:signal transduction histidine kinase
MALTLDVEKRKNIFLIFKEAINNAAKYSEGDKLTVSLSVQQQKLSLSVRDNGKGFNPALGTMGNGLKNMEDRAVAMHGKMTRISEPGKGTDIQLEMPLT